MNKDLEILRNGPICKYFKSSILDEDVNWFLDNRFDVYDIDLKAWNGRNFHENLKTEFSFPDYYGGNLAAFGDCLGDMFNPRYKGVVIVFRNYDVFYNGNSKPAIAILDIIAQESRVWLLDGQKLLALIHSNEPQLELPILGGVSPGWNSKEWLNKERS